MAHKFADYSEFGYGVAIVNDCKYGYAAQGNVMTISLLRASTAPDEQADQGPHDFSFGVYPHAGTYAESDVQLVAHAFNNPMQGETRTLSRCFVLNDFVVIKSPISSEHARVPVKVTGANNVLLETIKRGEDDFDSHSFVEKKGGKSLILRLHEHMGGSARVKLVMWVSQVFP